MEMAYYLNLALDNGVKASEISEIITHLAFYSGWENAMSAVVIAKRCSIGGALDRISCRSASVDLLPLDETAEKATRDQCRAEFRQGFAGRCAVHHRCALS